jgi:dephospho-CoA kinase
MKNSPLRVGLTGGIGTGKSTVARIFRLLGVPVYDADSMAKRLMEEEEELITAIKMEFGSNSYKDGKLNRQFLAEKVFNNEVLLKKLNAIVHPFVAVHFGNWTNQFGDQFILKEAALLFETGSYHELDHVILVQSPLETRVERIKNRDPQRSSKQILSIIESQIPVEEASSMADFIINNDELHMLIPQVLQLQKMLVKKKG